MRRLLRSLPAIALTLAACSESPVAPTPDAPREITALPRALSADERTVIAASNVFGFGLLRQLASLHREPNLFISPLSASMALGMTMNGVAGTAFDEMRSTLGFGTTPLDRIDASYRSLIDMLRALDPGVDFRIANSIWYRAGFAVEPSFVNTVQQYFDARVSALDFASPSAVPTINAWVDRSTNGKITSILDAPIDGTLVMFLMNAIYFKGSWTQQFDKARTSDDTFHAAGGASVPVKMMKAVVPGAYAQTADGEVLDLPYGGRAYSMTILLPKAGLDARSLAGTLTAAQWDASLATLGSARITLQAPKFRLEWKDRLDDALRAMGMVTPFNGGDWSPMSRADANDLVIDHVVQKTFVDVNEEGTEAAAVTSVGIGIVCACGPREVTVRIDRPFIFAIRERLSGTVLFLGVIEKP